MQFFRDKTDYDGFSVSSDSGQGKEQGLCRFTELDDAMHLQKLGELIVLLGGRADFTARVRNGRQRMWMPEYLSLPDNVRKSKLIYLKQNEGIFSFLYGNDIL